LFGLLCAWREVLILRQHEVLALKTMREDMSAKLVEHDEMNANLEKENELLHTTYAKCIEEEINNLRNMTCGTCERLKSQNEVLRTRCNSLCAKGLDSRFSCHFDVDASKFASSKPESTSSLEHESLDGGKFASALDSSPIANPKLVASSGVAKGDSNDKGASHFFGTHTSKPKFHCTFCNKDGHTVEFFFRRVKHERRVHVKAFKKPRSLSHGTCDSNVGTKSSLRLMLLALSPKGLLTYKRMAIHPLGLCLPIGLYTIALFVGRIGIMRAFATVVQGKHGELVLLGLWLFIA
jgi:hypothetical protein